MCGARQSKRGTGLTQQQQAQRLPGDEALRWWADDQQMPCPGSMRARRLICFQHQQEDVAAAGFSAVQAGRATLSCVPASKCLLQRLHQKPGF